MQIKKTKSIEEYREQIQTAILQNGPYSHNIVSLVLTEVSTNYGVEKVNELIKELNLTELYNISPVEEAVVEKQDVKIETSPVVAKEVEKLKETPYEHKRKVANEVIENLYRQLSPHCLDKENAVVYDLIKDGGWERHAYELRVQVYPQEHPSYYKKIRVYADLKGNGHYVHSNYKIYIRIDTDTYDIAFKKNWTPETKDLANKIHAKILEFIGSLKHKYESKVQAEKFNKTVKEKMAVEFPEAKNVWVNGNAADFYLREGKTTYNADSDTYEIELSGLTREQLQRILKIKQEN